MHRIFSVNVFVILVTFPMVVATQTLHVNIFRIQKNIITFTAFLYNINGDETLITVTQYLFTIR